MDIHRDVQSIREQAGFKNHDWDGLIYRRLATHLRIRNYDPATEAKFVPVDVEAQVVAAVAHEFEVGSIHLRDT